MKYFFVTGSDNYQNELQVRKTLTHIKNNYTDFIVISRGNKYGADIFIKNACDDLNLSYRESPPFNTKYVKNETLLFFPKYFYNMKYKTPALEVISSMNKIATTCNYFIFFINNENITKYDMLSLKPLIKKLKNTNNYVIFN